MLPRSACNGAADMPRGRGYHQNSESLVFTRYMVMILGWMVASCSSKTHEERRLQTVDDVWITMENKVVNPFCGQAPYTTEDVGFLGAVGNAEACKAAVAAVQDERNYAVFNVASTSYCYACTITDRGDWSTWAFADLPNAVSFVRNDSATTTSSTAAPVVITTTTTTAADPECGAYPLNMAYPVEIIDGQQIYREIQRNESHRYAYSNFNLSTMDVAPEFRKLLISLEPCRGVAYLFVRKSRHCYPDPYSCVDVTDRNDDELALCARTHFVSELNGTRDGAPTFFEIPLTSTHFYITVFAPEDAAYTLTVLGDVGAYPRPGNGGLINTQQVSGSQVRLAWEEASFRPEGVSEALQYWVYALLLEEEEVATSSAVFLRSSRIYNTVCGIHNISATNRSTGEADIMPADLCTYSRCNFTLDGLLTDRRYAFNVVVESTRGFRQAYAGTMTPSELQYEQGAELGLIPGVRRLSEAGTSSLLEGGPATASGSVVGGAVVGIMVLAGVIMMKVTSGKDKIT